MPLNQLKSLCQQLDPSFCYVVKAPYLYIKKNHHVLTRLNNQGRPEDFSDEQVKQLTDRTTLGRLRNLITQVFIKIN